MLPEVPRQLLRAKLDRRQDHLQLAPCTACGHDQMRVMLRSARVLHLQCERCAAGLTVYKPSLFGT